MTLSEGWLFCFPRTLMPPQSFFMRLHADGVLWLWRGVVIYDLMQTSYDYFYGSPED